MSNEQLVNPHCVIDGVSQPCGEVGTLGDVSMSYLAEVGQWALPTAIATMAVAMLALGVLVGWLLSGGGQ